MVGILIRKSGSVSMFMETNNQHRTAQNWASLLRAILSLYSFSFACWLTPQQYSLTVASQKL